MNEGEKSAKIVCDAITELLSFYLYLNSLNEVSKSQINGHSNILNNEALFPLCVGEYFHSAK
jgi:hypothetical protein